MRAPPAPSFMDNKRTYSADDVQPLAEALFRAVLHCSSDREVQVGCQPPAQPLSLGTRGSPSPGVRDAAGGGASLEQRSERELLATESGASPGPVSVQPWALPRFGCLSEGCGFSQ
jgi:hypothetical protein